MHESVYRLTGIYLMRSSDDCHRRPVRLPQNEWLAVE
jgi:hypothetical protein